MLAGTRTAGILSAVRQQGSARTNQLAVRFGVSELTIRRDIAALERKDLLKRVHGGAVLLEPVDPGALAAPATPDHNALSMAYQAAILVHPGMVVGLDAGEFSQALMVALGPIPGVTIVTNSLAVVREVDLREAAGREVPRLVLTGGSRVGPDALTGPIAVHTLERLHTDVAFINVIGLDAANGYSAATLDQAETSSAFARRAAATAVMLPEHLVGVRGICGIESLEPVGTIVCSRATSSAHRDLLHRFGRSVQVPPD